MARYPKKEAAMLPVLYLAQQEFGHSGPGSDRVCRPVDGSAAGAGSWCGELLHHVQHEAHRAPPYSGLPHACRARLRGAERSRGLLTAKLRHRVRTRRQAMADSRLIGSRVSGVLRHGADDAD